MDVFLADAPSLLLLFVNLNVICTDGIILLLCFASCWTSLFSGSGLSSVQLEPKIWRGKINYFILSSLKRRGDV